MHRQHRASNAASNREGMTANSTPIGRLEHLEHLECSRQPHIQNRGELNGSAWDLGEILSSLSHAGFRLLGGKGRVASRDLG